MPIASRNSPSSIWEFAFVEERDVQDTVEAMIRHVFKEVVDVELDANFPRITYAEALRRYGSDKPDLRIDLELVDIAEYVKHVEFKVFSGPANDPGGRVVALRLPGGASQPRKFLDDLGVYVTRYGAKGLAWIRVDDLAKGREGLTSPIIKFLDDRALNGILEAVATQSGDVIFFGAGAYKTVSDSHGCAAAPEGRNAIADWWPMHGSLYGLPIFRCSNTIMKRAVTSPCIIRSRRRRSTM